ncbi:sugar phosphate isomerase/epimerase [Candidatus Peregrinibacteria bacterium]|nr:sugar phosphate isomerase/epimerase [Candidatus Peregrinibacteria bacterium]
MLVLCTDSLRGYGLNRIFKFAKDAGYDGIDLAVSYGQFDTYNSAYVKELIAEYGIPVHAVSAPDQVSAKHIKELVDLAKEVGAKVLILQPPKFLDFKLASWLKKEIPKLREKEFLSIALENAGAGTFLGFIPEYAMGSADELKKFKHVALDTARIGEQHKDLMRAYKAFQQYLVHIHLSNVTRGKKYTPLKDGIMPLESFLTRLKQDKYPGAISIKMMPKFLGVGEDERVMEELEKAKKYYEKYYKNVQVVVEEKESGKEGKEDEK